VRSFNVAIAHLGTLQEAADALHNGDIPAFNQVAQRIAKEIGSPAPTNFDAVRQIVTNEVTKATVGSNNALGDRKEIADNVNNRSSPDQLSEMIGQYKSLMGGQLGGLQNQYYAGGGTKEFSVFMTPEAQAVVKPIARAEWYRTNGQGMRGGNPPPAASTGGGGGRQPTAEDIAWAKQNPKNHDTFVKSFGREP
jgi:hypothetical protein